MILASHSNAKVQLSQSFVHIDKRETADTMITDCSWMRRLS